MIVGDRVRYVAPDDIDPQYASREYSAVVTEVDPLDANAVGLFIFWPTYAFMAYRPLAGDPYAGPPVPLDDVAPYAGDTWHPIT